MIGSRVLLVDGSPLFRRALATVLTPHCAEVFTAADAEGARRELAGARNVDVLLSDVILRDGDGFQLLEDARGLHPRTKVILVASRPREEHEVRALSLGAAGYLPKPVSLRDVAGVLRMQQPGWRRARSARCRSLGHAVYRDEAIDEPSLLSWDIRDISESGAFLETGGPLEVGSELDLTLILGRRLSVQVKGLVVRVQPPSWATPWGIGVRFSGMTEGTRKVVSRYIERIKDELS